MSFKVKHEIVRPAVVLPEVPLDREQLFSFPSLRVNLQHQIYYPDKLGFEPSTGHFQFLSSPTNAFDCQKSDRFIVFFFVFCSHIYPPITKKRSKGYTSSLWSCQPSVYHTKMEESCHVPFPNGTTSKLASLFSTLSL